MWRSARRGRRRAVEGRPAPEARGAPFVYPSAGGRRLDWASWGGMPGSTRGQIFGGSKAVENRALNRVGVQPCRAVSARLLSRVIATVRRSGLTELTRDGLLVVEDFLPCPEFDELRDAAVALAGDRKPTAVLRSGGTHTDVWDLPPSDAGRFPVLDDWCGDRRVLDLVSLAEQQPVRRTDGMRTLEHLHIDDARVHDGQADLHMDAPFNTHKLWLYLDDVTPERAPFVYVPGSHKLDWVRLRGDYRESVGANRGSRRIDMDEIRRRGLAKRVVTCRRNTLVLANTCGYHSRSSGASGATRRALHMMFRSNPFAIKPRLLGARREPPR